MSGNKQLEEKLSNAISDLEKTPNIWGIAPVETEPEKWIDSWRVFKVVKTNGFEDRSGSARLDSISHFLSGSLAVNAYAAFCIAGRLSK